MVLLGPDLENDLEKKARYYEEYSKIEIVCQKKSPDTNPFTYGTKIKAPNSIFNGSKYLDNWRLIHMPVEVMAPDRRFILTGPPKILWLSCSPLT